MRDKVFARRIFGVADVVEQFKDQRSQERMAVGIDESRQGRAAGKIDDRGLAGPEAAHHALVADREHLTALDRER